MQELNSCVLCLQCRIGEGKPNDVPTTYEDNFLVFRSFVVLLTHVVLLVRWSTCTSTLQRHDFRIHHSIYYLGQESR